MTAKHNAQGGREAESWGRRDFSSSRLVLLCLVVLCSLSACQPLSTKRPSATNLPKSGDKSADKNSAPSEDLANPGTPVSQDTVSPLRKKIPTLREQMERLQSQQEQMNSRLDTVQSELRSIHQRVDEQLGAKTNGASKEAAFTKGDSPFPSTKSASSNQGLAKNSDHKGSEPGAESKVPTKSQTKSPKGSSSGVILPDGEDAENSTESKSPQTKTAKKKSVQDGESGESGLKERLGDIIKADNESGETKKPVIRRSPKPRPKTPVSTEPAVASKTASSQPKSIAGAAKEPSSKATPNTTSPASATKSAGKEPKSQLDAAMGEAPGGKTEAINPLFNTATNLFNKKQYQEAIDVFNQVSAQEKNPEMQSRAQYWIGESYFGLAKYDDAIRTFNKVLASKSTEKSSKAMSMIAESMIRLGQTAEAKKTYQRLQKQYPQSEEAVRAAKRLQQL